MSTRRLRHTRPTYRHTMHHTPTHTHTHTHAPFSLFVSCWFTPVRVTLFGLAWLVLSREMPPGLVRISTDQHGYLSKGQGRMRSGTFQVPYCVARCCGEPCTSVKASTAGRSVACLFSHTHLSMAPSCGRFPCLPPCVCMACRRLPTCSQMDGWMDEGGSPATTQILLYRDLIDAFLPCFASFLMRPSCRVSVPDAPWLLLGECLMGRCIAGSPHVSAFLMVYAVVSGGASEPSGLYLSQRGERQFFRRD